MLLSGSGSSATGRHTLACPSSSPFGFSAIVLYVRDKDMGELIFYFAMEILNHLNIKVTLCILTSQINQTLPCV